MRQHALITGGSSGIGLALAGKLAAEGFSLSLIARRESVLSDAATALRRLCVHPEQEIFTHVADVADAAAAQAAVGEATARLGVPDLVVTSAGMAHPGYFEDISLRTHEQSMAVNYFGTLYVVNAVLPAMRARRSGRIVMIASGASLLGIFGYASYCPSKFALKGLAETLHAELKAEGVGISIAYPPDTETPMLVEENKIKPEETKLITGLVKPWTADKVADCIIDGIDRERFAITPGATITAMNRMPGILLPILRWYSDRLASKVRRSKSRAISPAVASSR
ncbi:MAG TPA: SDR family oxidoreductase [Stellaceae bacterium]|jgi:3-dehydrosphinganine reductase|nr:SDR family oxidoreductase [Stellaceae bacterium]HEX4191789.1 SDR family oxidoreductase [Stellaceae bacterium]